MISHPSEEGARSTVSTCSESLRSTRARFKTATPTVPCVGRDTRKPPLPPLPLSPIDIIAVVEAEDASTTTLPSSPLGTGTGGGEEGRANLAGAPGAERPRYDHMRGACAVQESAFGNERRPPESFFSSPSFYFRNRVRSRTVSTSFSFVRPLFSSALSLSLFLSFLMLRIGKKGSLLLLVDDEEKKAQLFLFLCCRSVAERVNRQS